jgi:hypothetical protein
LLGVRTPRSLGWGKSKRVRTQGKSRESRGNLKKKKKNDKRSNDYPGRE